MKIKDLLNAKLLTGVAVIGVGATIFFAVRETKKAVAAEPMPKDQPMYKTAYKFAWLYRYAAHIIPKRGAIFVNA